MILILHDSAQTHLHAPSSSWHLGSLDSGRAPRKDEVSVALYCGFGVFEQALTEGPWSQWRCFQIEFSWAFQFLCGISTDKFNGVNLIWFNWFLPQSTHWQGLTSSNNSGGAKERLMKDSFSRLGWREHHAVRNIAHRSCGCMLSLNPEPPPHTQALCQPQEKRHLSPCFLHAMSSATVVVSGDNDEIGLRKSAPQL